MGKVQTLITLVCLISVVSNLYLSFRLYETDFKVNPKKHYSKPFSFTQVKRIKWDYNNSLFLKELLEEGKPVVLVGAPSSKWYSHKHWSAEYMIGLLGIDFKVNEVWSSPSSLLRIKKSEFSWPQWIDHNEKLEMTVPQLFNRLKKPDVYQYLHFSARVEPSGYYSKLWNDIHPYDFSVDQESSLDEGIHAHFSSAGGTVQCHYDYYHDFFVQVRGEKEVVVVPPNMNILKPYPFSHPYSSYSQLNFTTLTQNEQKEMNQKGVLETNLERGEVLYLPPLWSQHSTNIDGISISLNIQLESHLQHIKTLYLDSFEAFEGEIIMKKGFVMYTIELLFERVEKDVTKWMRKHFELRYRSLFVKELQSEEKDEYKLECTKLPSLSRKVTKVAARMVEEFYESFPSVPYQMQDLFLGDYIDTLLYTYIPPPQTLYLVKYCF